MSMILGFVIGVILALLVSYKGQGESGPIDKVGR